MRKKFPFFEQQDSKDCGPTCLKIISSFYGKKIDINKIRNLAETTRLGSSLLGLSRAAESIGFRTLAVKVNFKVFIENAPLPCICHWNNNHFVVVYKIIRGKKIRVFVSDPAYGLIEYSKTEFIKSWTNSSQEEDNKEGFVLFLDPTSNFYKNDDEIDINKTNRFSRILKYFFRYKRLIYQLIIGLIVGSILSLILPFITQSVVDIGIQNQDIDFIYLVLIAQIMLIIGKISLETIRSWILLHISTRVNISIVSDFFIKLTNLPISFFDTRMTGDILQRINDHDRVERIITNTSISTLFSMINLLIFSIILLYYNYTLFFLYLFGTILYITWVAFFMKKRKMLDYKNFYQVSQEQSKVIEMISGMQEIKLYNIEKQKRWSWEFLQVKLFKLKVQTLSLELWQSVGGNSINQIKDILISFFSAKLVIEGNISLGMMLSIQYIIGQMNVPLTQMIDFIKSYQDAKISLERLNEIHDMEDEEKENSCTSSDIRHDDINITNLSFKYRGANSFLFENLNITFPKRKITAIVGTSGSGKTTLLKLLMKFYDPTEGKIEIGTIDLKNISPSIWREYCAVIMQEGYIFNDTVANNIALEDNIDRDKLRKSVEVANIKDFIEGLPSTYNTKIGNEGIGMSGGQKQRLFIARAVYKEPEYIFLDEATSSLDANNEKIIMRNLELFLKGKTAIIIAHRLSTVKNADKIIVLDKGKVVEEGNHNELIGLKGEYYKLIKNQLELGN